MIPRKSEQRALKPVKVTISYCSECGYEPQTLALAEALMREFRHELAGIEILPWYEGTFDVVVDGELVHSMEREGGFAEHAAVIEAVRRRQATPKSETPPQDQR